MPKSREKALTPLAPRRVLVPTDLSPLGNHAIQAALDLLGKGTKMRLFHASAPVYTAAAAYGPEGPVPIYDSDLSRHHLAKVKRQLDRLARTLHAEALVVESGSPAKAIAEQAKAWKADMVVLSSHGRSGMSRLLFGSVTQKLLAHYHGAVLVYKPKMGR